MAKLNLFGTSKMETTEASDKKVSSSKKRKRLTRRKDEMLDSVSWYDNHELVFEPKKELLTFGWELPEITIVSASEKTHQVLCHLESVAKENNFLNLVQINHLSSNNFYFRYQSPVKTIDSNCYDLSNPEADGHGEFYAKLHSVLEKTELVIVLGEEYGENFANNKMPLLKFGNVPVVHFIDKDPHILGEINNKGFNLIFFSTWLLSVLLGISSNYEFIDDQACLNKTYAQIIKAFVVRICKQSKNTMRDLAKTVVKVEDFECSWDILQPIYHHKEFHLQLATPYSGLANLYYCLP